MSEAEEGSVEVKGALGGFNFGIENDLSRNRSSSLERGRETTRASSDTSLGMDITKSALSGPSA